MTFDDADPKGLIRESYAIAGITPGECRSIFMDWALSLPAGVVLAQAAGVLLAHYRVPGHPMNAVLELGMQPPPEPRRRGGRAGRIGG